MFVDVQFVPSSVFVHIVAHAEFQHRVRARVDRRGGLRLRPPTIIQILANGCYQTVQDLQIEIPGEPDGRTTTEPELRDRLVPRIEYFPRLDRIKMLCIVVWQKLFFQSIWRHNSTNSAACYCCVGHAHQHVSSLSDMGELQSRDDGYVIEIRM